MSLSTTTTATYEITKYSRAYNHSPNPQSGQPDLQWQHFVNPIIRLTLDTRKSAVGHLESYRLRIIWTFNAELNSMDVDQREVVFEDLDLVTYSTMPSLQGPQGMPLKAVYQDSTVGLRYQHPRVVAPGASPQYRRFQIVFESTASATSFVDSIRFICPCKANAAPPPRVPRAPTTQFRAPAPASRNSMAPQSTTIPPLGTSLRPNASAMPVDGPPPAFRRTDTTLPPFSTLASSQGLHPAQSSDLYASSGGHQHPSLCDTGYSGSERHDAYSSSRPSSAVTASSAIAHHSSDLSPGPPVGATAPIDPARRSSSIAPGGSLGRLLNETDPSQTQAATAPVACRASGSSDTTLPSSSFPHSSSSPPPAARPRPSSPDLMPPPPVPMPSDVSRALNACGTASQELSSGLGTSAAPAPPVESVSTTAQALRADSAKDITASLRGGEGLHDLSKAELEKLVSEVIREDGFADLMKALDGMWRVKGLMRMT
ncbi:hypothetical protein C8Q78DRAFT_1083488 [Trametes maxima]|nr:hypothetical protein C8Q78DRAFT_1083488 [Trametes maxima]